MLQPEATAASAHANKMFRTLEKCLQLDSSCSECSFVTPSADGDEHTLNGRMGEGNKW